MGTSFTTTHIHNAQNLTKKQFKKVFADMMKAKGYTASDDENAALTYTLVFAPDRKWVTVLTDGADTRRETAELAKGLKAHAVMIDLVDSDFAELSLFDEAGAHKDTLTLGNSYLEDAAPMGDPAAWQPLLCGSWEQVQEIQKGSYTFAEDALVQFAPLIGMDRGNILLDNDSADDNAVVLHFKKAAEKKLTLNSAFVKVFGEVLEPLGFVKTKLKHCYIRVVNNEFVEVVRINPEIPMFTPGQDLTLNKYFDIYCAAFTLYENNIARYFNNGRGMFNLYESADNLFYKKTGTFFDSDKYSFFYSETDVSSLLKALKLAVDFTRENIIPLFDTISDIKSYIDFADVYMGLVDTFPLLILLDDCKMVIQKQIDEALENAQNDDDEASTKELLESIAEYKKRVSDILDNTDHYQEFMKQMEDNKSNNINYLNSSVIILS